MRYKKNETTILAGKLPAGKTVTIKIINMNDDLVEVTSNECVESKHISGMYLWDTANIMGEKSGHMIYEMTDGDKIAVGKFVYSEYISEEEMHAALDEYENKKDWGGYLVQEAREQVVTEVWSKIV